MKAKIIHFSDTHVPAVLGNWRGLFDKRLVGTASSILFRRGRYDQSRLATAIQYILKEKPDLALFTGDATSCGQPDEFASALRTFRPLLKSDIPFLYIPGNHDAYVNDPVCRSALERFTYAMLRGDHRLSSFPFTLEFSCFKILAIHCARPFNPLLSCGYMEPRTRRFLLDEIARRDSRPLICATHFPLLTDSSLWNFRRRLYGAADAGTLVQNHVLDLSLCGHIHHTCDLLNERGRGEIVAGSLTKTGLFSEITYDTDTDIFSLKRISVD